MADWTIENAATHLLAAEAERRDITPITEEWPGLDTATGYAVQDALIRVKETEGHTVVGVKLGLTSRAKQARMGIDSPLTAVITDRMQLDDGEPAPFDRLIHPRIEPEIVFVMATELAGPGVTARSALAAVESVHAGFEIIDSRFRDFKFTLPDVIADNASSSYFIVGGQSMDPRDLDLAAEEVIVKINGLEVDRATGAAVQGHPAEALALAANALAERGRSIPAGSIVLTGGMTDALFLNPADEVSAEFASLGTVTVPAQATHR